MPLLLAVGAIGVGVAITALSGKCLDLGIISVGCSQDQALTISNRLQQTITQDVKQSAKASIVQTTTAQNVLEFIDIKSLCKDLNINQSITGNINYVAKISQTLDSEIKASMTEYVDTAIDALNEAQKSFLSGAMNGKQAVDLRNELVQAINMSVTQESLGSILQTINVGNTLRVSGILQGDSCNFNQNIVLDVFSTAVITQVMKNVMSGVLVQDIIQNVKLVQKTKSSLTWLWILLGIVALLGLIGLVWFIYKKQHGSSSSAGTSGTGGGTNIIFSPGATRPTTTTPAPAPAPVLPTPRVTPAASSVS
jgi:hypothetical protein